MTYLRYIGPALWIWAKGIRWLWTRQGEAITYKPGWGPWKFLPIYLFDYGLAVLLGYGCISISRHKRLFGKSHWARTGPRLWGVEGIR